MALRHTMDRNVEEILAVYEDVVDLRRRRAASATAEARRPQPFAELSAFRDERKTNPTKE